VIDIKTVGAMQKNSLATRIRHFATAESGKAVVLFGLALVPLAGLVGAACDYTRAATARAEMQAVADATANMLAQEPAGLSADLVRQKAGDYFRAHYQRRDVAGLEIAAGYDEGGARHVAVATQGSLDTDFMRLFGVETMTVRAESALVRKTVAAAGDPVPRS